MRPDLIARSVVTVNASPSRVWEALVTPSLIAQYMFGAEVRSDFTPGSPITWSGEYQGKRYQDHGVIQRANPGCVLEYTHVSGENRHTVTIELARAGAGGTRITLSQDGNATEEARAHSAQNWDAMLAALKQLVERGWRAAG